MTATEPAVLGLTAHRPEPRRPSNVRFAEMTESREIPPIDLFALPNGLEEVEEGWGEVSEVTTDPEQGTDTDLDMNENEMDKILGRRKKDRSDCRTMYEAACKRFEVVPSSQFINQLKGKNIQMTNLNLEDHEIKAMCIPLLYNTTVTAIDFSRNRFGMNGCRHILEMLKENVYITEVLLADNNLGVKGARYICRALRTHERIKHIDLSGNKFSEYDAREFADMLRHNVALKRLNLSHNAFGEKGGVLIGAALADNVSLDELDLSWNHIRLDGATAISKSLKENDSLIKLSVAWNGFGNEGAQALGEALSENSTLQELDLSCNRINIEGMGYLINGLQANEGLKVLKLRSNPISSIGAERLLKVLKDSEQTRMTQVDIDDVPVTYNFGVLLEQLKEFKKEIDVHHDRFVRGTDYIARGVTKDEYISDDPLKLLKIYVREKSLNLVDYFVNCDEEEELSLKEDQFRKAIQLASIPINDHQLDELVKGLQKTDEEGFTHGVDLSNLVNSKEYRSKRRKRKPVARSHQAPDLSQLDVDMEREPTAISDGELSAESDLVEEVDIILADDGRTSSVAGEAVDEPSKSGDVSARNSKTGDVSATRSKSGDHSGKSSKHENISGRKSNDDRVSRQKSRNEDANGRSSAIDTVKNNDVTDSEIVEKPKSSQERGKDDDDKAFPLTEPEPTMVSVDQDD